MLADFSLTGGTIGLVSSFGLVTSPSHFPAVAFHFSLAAQAQAGAVLVFSTHLVHDLIQSEVQAAHPSAHFKQVFFFSSDEYPALQVLHSASLSAQSLQLVTLQATQAFPLTPYPVLQVAGSANPTLQVTMLASFPVQALQVVPPATGPNLSLQVVQVSLEHFKQSFPQVVQVELLKY